MWIRGGVYRLVFNASVWHSNIIHIASIIYSTQNILIAFDRPVCIGLPLQSGSCRRCNSFTLPAILITLNTFPKSVIVFFPGWAMPVYQIDELNHYLGSLSASLSERGWVNMLPMHERLSMGRPIVLRVRQVVDCLLFPHYLSMTWAHRGKGTPRLFT